MKHHDDRLNVSRIALALTARLPARDRGHVILVTSAAGGEGKSFVSSLLAMEFSQTTRTDLVLIDACEGSVDEHDRRVLDDRVPTGLAQLVEEGVLPDPAAWRHGSSRLFFLPGGQRVGAAVFNASGVRRAFDTLRKRFQLNVVDGPSMDACGAMLLEADAILLVVDSLRTSPETIHSVMAAMQLAPPRITGVVLNHARPDQTD